MALLTSSAPTGIGSRTAPQKKATQVKVAQALAKQKSLEKKAKSYRLPLGELAIFTQQLASLLTAGLPLVQCLEALQDQTEDQVFKGLEGLKELVDPRVKAAGAGLELLVHHAIQ